MNFTFESSQALSPKKEVLIKRCLLKHQLPLLAATYKKLRRLNHQFFFPFSKIEELELLKTLDHHHAKTLSTNPSSHNPTPALSSTRHLESNKT